MILNRKTVFLSSILVIILVGAFAIHRQSEKINPTTSEPVIKTEYGTVPIMVSSNNQVVNTLVENSTPSNVTVISGYPTNPEETKILDHSDEIPVVVTTKTEVKKW